MEIFKLIIFIILAYLIGAIPFSFIIVKKIKTIDIRTVGSENVGATNAGRVLGKKWFFIITLLDASKGITVILIAKYFIQLNVLPLYAYILIGFAAIIGHTYSPYVNFKGGKGVAVSAGVLIAINYQIVLICIPVFVITVMISKYISLGSLLGSISIPLSIILIHKNQKDFSYLLIFGIAVAIYVIYKHKENIIRLLKGTENKWNMK